jgi:hypothetical protein
VSHEVEGAVHAGIAGAEDLVLGQIGDGIAGGVAVPEVQELDALRAVVDDVLVVEGDIGLLEFIFLDVFAILAAFSRTSVLVFSNRPVGRRLPCPDAVAVGIDRRDGACRT